MFTCRRRPDLDAVEADTLAELPMLSEDVSCRRIICLHNFYLGPNISTIDFPRVA